MIYLSSVQYLNKIYTLEGQNEGEVGSVFFEFQESKPLEDADNYTIRALNNLSKCPDLLPDSRIPKGAKKAFCFGFTIKKGNESVKSLGDLIAKVDNWVTGGKKPVFEVSAISIDVSMLESNPCKMPAKNYDGIYQLEDGQYLVPVHLRDPNYSNPWK